MSTTQLIQIFRYNRVYQDSDYAGYAEYQTLRTTTTNVTYIYCYLLLLFLFGGVLSSHPGT